MPLTGRPEQTDDAVIGNDDFFPDLQLADFLQQYQITNSYSDELIIFSVQQSMIKINLRLQPFKTAQLLAGYSSLNAYVSANQRPVGSDDLINQLYKKAVFCTAKVWCLVDANGGVAKHADDSASLRDLNSTVKFWLDEAGNAAYTFLSLFGLEADPVSTIKSLHAQLI